MALKRWSLSQLLVWIATIAMVIAFVPLGLYLTATLSASESLALTARGRSLAKAVGEQVVEPMLVEDRLSLHDALHKAASTDGDVRYICVEDPGGRVLTDTFDAGCPPALRALWQRVGMDVALFRADGREPLCDIRAPILDGQLGMVHVGMSRRAVVAAGKRRNWMMGIALAGALLVALVSVQLVAARMTRPLQQVESAVSSFPGPRARGELAKVGGTREVRSLAAGFAEMIDRIEAAEAERAATQDRMIHAERLAALGELAAGLSHEIRNPLDGMLECLRFLDADGDKSPRADKYYPMLQAGLNRIDQAMRGMLTLARSGNHISLCDCTTSELFEALKLLVSGYTQHSKVNLEWASPGSCICRCDRRGLLQAGLNLAINATDAARSSPRPKVRIEAVCDEQWTYLSFEDSGPGVSPELADRVFEPFFTTKPPDKGTGLGLSVSRQLIRASGGELELSPDPSALGGARFVIRLPRISCSTEDHDCQFPQSPDR